MGPPLQSGRTERLPYSLSRWTDVPGAKWGWFQEALRQREMIAIDPRTGVPGRWSLAPEETLGLVWWTKAPTVLADAAADLKPYDNQFHVTITGWHEVEKGVPHWRDAAEGLVRLSKEFGKGHVIWRFSPVPVLPGGDLVTRFASIANKLKGHVGAVYLSFLQENDLMPEKRSAGDRVTVMKLLAEVAADRGIKVLLCNEDRTLAGLDVHPNLAAGVCAQPEYWMLDSREKPPSEGCGCVLMADPFTINESCTFGCQYCYAADKSLAPKKRNTTKGHLPVVP